MNAAKAASRMRSRTAVSSPPSWRGFDIDALAITLSLTTLVPYSTSSLTRQGKKWRSHETFAQVSTSHQCLVPTGTNRARKEKIMTKPTILVTGATGKTGSVVASELLKAGYPVRAMVRREDDRSARLKAQGAEIAVTDMSDV